MPTAAERYKFSEVEEDGKTFIQDMFQWCNVYNVANINQECVMKAGNKDVLAANLVRALALIERQNNMIINQRVHIDAYKTDIIKMQDQIITVQERVITMCDGVTCG